MRTSRGYSLIELLISMGIGGIVLAGLVSLIFILYRDKSLIDQSNSLEETRRLISLQINARMRDALNTEVWLNTETLRAIGIPIDSMTPPSITPNLYPSGLVLKDKAIDSGTIVDAPNSDILFFISRDPQILASEIADDSSGSPAFPDAPYLYRLSTASPYLYLKAAPTPTDYPAGSDVFIGTPAGAVLSRINAVSGTRIELTQAPFGLFDPMDPASTAAVRILSRGMFFGRLKVSAIGIEAGTRDLVVADVLPAGGWSIRDRYPLAVEEMIFDVGVALPPTSTVILFDPLAHQHTISIRIKRVLLTGQTTGAGTMDFEKTDSILSISL